MHSTMAGWSSPIFRPKGKASRTADTLFLRGPRERERVCSCRGKLFLSARAIHMVQPPKGDKEKERKKKKNKKTRVKGVQNQFFCFNDKGVVRV